MNYSYIINNNLLVQKKEKYTIKDFKKLVAAGFTQTEARFILICSLIYYYDVCIENYNRLSKYMWSEAFTIKCRYNNAI